MNKPLYYDRDGQPITHEQWAVLFEQSERRIAVTEISDDIHVSTVWLGLDHSFSSTGRPLIFESMIFGGPLDQDGRRYATEAEARAGHDELVTLARTEHELTD